MFILEGNNATELEHSLELKIRAGEVPSVLYKFRLWNDPPNDNILKKLQIRLASPFELQADYSETILPIDESVITEEYKSKVALHQAKVMYPHLSLSEQQKEALQLMKHMTIDNKEEREWAYRQSRIRNNEVRGIFCGTYTFRHLDQWVHLAGNATGYAVGLDTKRIYLNERILGSAGYVDYYDESNPPKVPPVSFTMKELLEHTSMELYNIPERYAYEREYRIVRTNQRYNDDGKVAQYSEEERIIQLIPEDYVEILLGFDISEKDKNEIIEMRNTMLPKIPIYETIKEGSFIKRGKMI